MLTTLSVTDFLDELASGSPAPGGGSVSALVASLGAALTSMVCRLTIGKKKYADVQAEIEKVLEHAEELRTQFNAMIDEDTAAFNKVMIAYGLPKETEEQKMKRTAEIQDAIKTATLVPLKLMGLCIETLELVKIIVEKGNQSSISDAGVAALLLRAGCEGAALNVKTNLGSLHDANFANQTRTKMEQHLTSLETFSTSILASMNKTIQ